VVGLTEGGERAGGRLGRKNVMQVTYSFSGSGK